MSSQQAMTILSGVEFATSAVLAFAFWKKGLRHRFPAMGAYLLLRVASTPIFSLLLLAQTGQLGATPPVMRLCAQVYFFSFWVVYVASATLLYFICVEIFRWAAVVSLIVTFSSNSFVHRGVMVLPDIGIGLMRSVGLLELCLLAFLCLSMNAL